MEIQQKQNGIVPKVPRGGSREAIVEAASRLFLERGFSGGHSVVRDRVPIGELVATDATSRIEMRPPLRIAGQSGYPLLTRAVPCAAR